MDPETVTFMRTVRRFLDDLPHEHGGGSELTELGEFVRELLGVSPQEADSISEVFPEHQVIDLDVAIEGLLTRHGGRQLGVTGQNRVHVSSFLDLLVGRRGGSFVVGPVSYVRMATGPDTERRVVAYGVATLSIGGVPVVVLQRGRSPEYGRETYSIEVMSPTTTVSESFLAQVHAAMSEHSVIRGQVVSFQRNDFDYHGGGGLLTFLRRPQLGAEQVILPAGVLERVSGHVIEIGQQRERLVAAGQHLKRGVLLYGPPGTGKTHLVRHLLAATPGTTAVLLSGRTLGALAPAAKLARACQPAIIVMEDCDLVAEERGGDSNAALFETLEAMDGLDGDADITFILTTNRPDLLERALVERPGRVDLAVEIARPDLDGRRRLFALYGGELLASGQLSAEVLDEAAERTEGVTASFAKEAVRRALLQAARADRPAVATDLLSALDDMLSDAETLTRSLLGARDLPWAEEEDVTLDG